MNRTFGEVEFPEKLIQSLEDDRLVIFAGAGVSRGPPAGLPSFSELVDGIAAKTTLTPQDSETEDQFLGRLDSTGVSVHGEAAEILELDDPVATQLHRDLTGLFKESSDVRIVTTNFDRLFERAADDCFDKIPPVFEAPALPLGDDFRGIVHLHGSLKQNPSQLILTDRDFGEAYLSRAWARRFLVDLFGEYAVLFVGYSHEDTVMQYLARGLPAVDRSPRFALVPEEDEYNPESWHLRGIEPISYPVPAHDHQALNDAVQKWREQRERGALDVKQRVKRLVNLPVESDGDDHTDKIAHLTAQSESFLNDVVRSDTDVQFFTNNTTDPRWVDWLDDQGHLEPIFRSEPLDEPLQKIAHWLGADVAIEAPEKVMQMVASKKSGQLPFALAGPLAWTLAISENGDYETLTRWIPFLLRWISGAIDPFVRSSLLERLVSEGAESEFVSVFRELTCPKAYLELDFSTVEDEPHESDSEASGSAGLPIEDHQRVKDIIWDAIDEFSKEGRREIFDSAVGNLKEYRRVDLRDNKGVVQGLHRSAIEPHEQDRHPRDIDILIDTVRDILQGELVDESDYSTRRIKDLIESRNTLLNRIGLFGMRKSSAISANKKLRTIVEKEWVFDVPRKHEVFLLMKDAYMGADEEARKELVKCIDEYEDPDSEEGLVVRSKFTRLKYLEESGEADELLTAKLEQIKDAHPDWTLGEHPDLLGYVSEPRWVGSNPRKEADEILKMEPSEVVTWLAESEGDEEGFDRREGDIRQVEAAVSKAPSWGVKLLTDLFESEGAYEGLWIRAILGLTDGQLKEDDWERLLSLLVRHKDKISHYRNIANLLTKGMRAKSIPTSSISAANEVIRTLWHDCKEPGWENVEEWHRRAINTPHGRIAEYWVQELSICFNRGEEELEGMPFVSDILEEIAGLLQQGDVRSKLAVAGITPFSDFLLNVDRAWTEDTIVPQLKFDNSPEAAKAAWSGMNYVQQLSPEFEEAFRSSYMSLFGNLDKGPVEFNRGLVRHVAIFAFYTADDPASNWLHPFLQEASPELRLSLIKELGGIFDDLDLDAQEYAWNEWLKEFVRDYCRGMPVKPTPQERGAMVSWVKDSELLLEEFLELDPLWNETLDFGEVHLGLIQRSELVEEKPEEVAQYVQQLVYSLPEQDDSYCPRICYEMEQLIDKGVDGEKMRDAADRVRELGCSGTERLFEKLSETSV